MSRRGGLSSEAADIVEGLSFSAVLLQVEPPSVAGAGAFLSSLRHALDLSTPAAACFRSTSSSFLRAISAILSFSARSFLQPKSFQRCRRDCKILKTTNNELRRTFQLTSPFPVPLLDVYVPPPLAYVALLDVCVQPLLPVASCNRLYVSRRVPSCVAPDVLCGFSPIPCRTARVSPTTQPQY